MPKQPIFYGSSKSKNAKRIRLSLQQAFNVKDEETVLLTQALPGQSKLAPIENNSVVHLISHGKKDIDDFCNLVAQQSLLARGSRVTIVLWQSHGAKYAKDLVEFLHQRGVNADVYCTKSEMDRFSSKIKDNIDNMQGKDYIKFVAEKQDIRKYGHDAKGVTIESVKQLIAFEVIPATIPANKPSSSNPAAQTQYRANISKTTPRAPLPKKVSLPRIKIKVPKYQSTENTAPPIFHFVWVGGPIPENYLKSLKKICDVAERSGFEVNLWVDNIANYHKASVAHEINIPNLKIREVDGLIEGMKNDPLYNEDNNFIRFLTDVNREMIGYKNLAAASDFLRNEILRQFGGYYFDTDLEFVLNENSRFVPDNLPLGIKLRTNLHLIEGELIEARITGQKDTNNDLMIAIPNHPVIVNMIKESLNVYKVFDTKKSEEHADLTKMDKKRFPYPLPSKLPSDLQENRRNLTLASGPDLILRCMPDYVNQLQLTSTDENIVKVKSMLLERNPRVANVIVKHHSDLTWAIKRFEIVLVNDDNIQLTPEILKLLSSRLNDNPVLFKQGDQFYIYGRAGNDWKITSFSKAKELIDQITWPKGAYECSVAKPDQLPAVLYNLIAATDSHIPPRPKVLAFEAEAISSRLRLFGYSNKIHDVSNSKTEITPTERKPGKK